jgi:hypothetical protein
MGPVDQDRRLGRTAPRTGGGPVRAERSALEGPLTVLLLAGLELLFPRAGGRRRRGCPRARSRQLPWPLVALLAGAAFRSTLWLRTHVRWVRRHHERSTALVVVAAGGLWLLAELRARRSRPVDPGPGPTGSRGLRGSLRGRSTRLGPPPPAPVRTVR